MAKNVVVSLSGGMDSSTLLLRCLSEYDNVTALSFDYGQKHRVELERAQSLVDYLNANGQKVTYQVIKLDGLVNLLNSPPLIIKPSIHLGEQFLSFLTIGYSSINVPLIFFQYAIVNGVSCLLMKQTYRKFMGNIKEKKSEYQDYNLHSSYMITASFQTKNCSAFCTANQSTKTNLKKLIGFSD